MTVDLKFIPLTFITSNDEILKQIKNTVLFSFLLNKYEETSLSYYIETTQYGFTASALEKGSHKIVRITDIKNGKVDWHSVPFCNCDTDKKYLLKDHDILIARTGGTTGKSFIVSNPPKNAVFASYLIRLRLNKNADVDFITCFLNSYLFWSQIIEMKSGSAMPNVNAEKLKTLKLPKCDVKTQKDLLQAFQNEQNKNGLNALYQKANSIEMLFKDSNELSSNLNNQQEILTQLRQSFLREAMQGKLVKQDPKDGHAKDLLEKIKAEKAKSGKKEKELPPIKPEEIPFDIPENWVWCRLSEVGRITGGGTPSMSNPQYWNGNIPWVSPKDMGVDFVSDTEMKVTKKGVEESTTNLIPIGSLLIVGRSGILKRKLPVAINKVECTVNQDMKVIIPYIPLMNRFLQLMFIGLQEIILKDYVKFGMTVHSLKYNEFALMPIPLPPLKEQAKIVEKLEELLMLCDNLQNSIQASKEQNELLLQQVLKEALQTTN